MVASGRGGDAAKAVQWDIAAHRRWWMPMGSPGDADNDLTKRRQLRDTFIESLKRDRRWFKRRRIQLQFLWTSLTLINIFLGLLTSMLIAIGFPRNGNLLEKAILVALPAVATFCGTLLVHLRLRENWELRELGRVDVDEAIVEARFIDVKDVDHFNSQL